MTPAEILARAADILEARGEAFSARPYSTLARAFDEAAVNTGLYFSAAALIADRVDEHAKVWITMPGRTLPQVLAMLRGEDWRKA